MSGAYWYISKAKLDLLKQATPRLLEGLSVNLEFKLPFVSGHLAGTDQPTLIRDLERVVKKLESKGEIKSYSELGEGEAPVMVRFEGPAVRAVDSLTFWVATRSAESTLLLAGSAGYAIGQPPGGTGANISPSADPLGAVQAAFKRGSEEPSSPGMSLSSRLGYVWEEVMRDSLQSGATLPKAEGIAIFASSIPLPSGLQLAGCEGIRQMVVGTPLYVRQI